MLNIAINHEDGEGEVQVVYGTTKLKMMQRHHDFYVTNLAEMDECGLDKATRFDLDKIGWMPWASEWFVPLLGYSSPIMGHLSSHSTRLLQIELAHRSRRQLEKVAPNEGD